MWARARLTSKSVADLVPALGKLIVNLIPLSKHAGRGMKGTFARNGGKINRGFEGGQSNLAKRFPKRGFKPNKFNIKRPLEQLNLGKLAYHISKGQLDTS